MAVPWVEGKAAAAAERGTVEALEAVEMVVGIEAEAVVAKAERRVVAAVRAAGAGVKAAAVWARAAGGTDAHRDDLGDGMVAIVAVVVVVVVGEEETEEETEVLDWAVVVLV